MCYQLPIATCAWTMAAQLRYTELFAGVGGFGEALRSLGGECVLACEVESQARRAFALNNAYVAKDDERFPKDVRQVPVLPDHDILTGGFPCQPFSRAGAQPGLAGKKGSLFLEVVRLMKTSRPPMFLLENVAGLLSLPGAAGASGRLPEAIQSALEGAGPYTVRCRVIDSGRVLPQARRRCYIVGFLDAAAASRFRWPALPRLMRGAGDVLAGTEARDAVHFTLKAAQWEQRLERSAREHWLLDPSRPVSTLTRSYRALPGRSSAARANEARAVRSAPPRGAPLGGWNNLVAAAAPIAVPPAPCSAGGPAASVAAGVEASRPRFFTHRECARLMGFSESFRVLRENDASGPASALFGNAVCPPIIAAVAACMLAARDGGAVADCPEAPAKRRRVVPGVASNAAPPAARSTAIGHWTCPGARAALTLVLDAVDPRARDALARRIRVAAEEVLRGVGGHFDADAQTDVAQKAPLVCFRYRDTGVCAWGDKCRFSHEVNRL